MSTKLGEYLPLDLDRDLDLGLLVGLTLLSPPVSLFGFSLPGDFPRLLLRFRVDDDGEEGGDTLPSLSFLDFSFPGDLLRLLLPVVRGDNGGDNIGDDGESNAFVSFDFSFPGDFLPLLLLLPPLSSSLTSGALDGGSNKIFEAIDFFFPSGRADFGVFGVFAVKDAVALESSTTFDFDGSDGMISDDEGSSVLHLKLS